MPADTIRLGDILQAAVSKGDVDRVRELLEKGAPVKERGEHGMTALHWAASNDEDDIVRALLQAGADPNARAVDGCTPLHYAAREDAVKAAAILLCYGADCRVTNNSGRVAGEEIYDDQDGGEGAEIARMLADAAGRAPREPTASNAFDGEVPRSTNEGASGRWSGGGGGDGAVQLSSVGASTGVTFSSLEMAVADMAALLRKEKARGSGTAKLEGDPCNAIPLTATEAVQAVGGDTAGPIHTKGASGGGGTGTSTSGTGDGGGGGRVIVPRKYVAAADHDAPPARCQEARTVTVRLRTDGTLSDEHYAAVRQAYIETGLPRVDPQAAVGYERIPEVAATKLEARRKAAQLTSTGSGD